MDKHKADNCLCHKQVSSTQQTISEIDFDRGIWNAAIYNEPDRVREFIAKGKSMQRDNCDYTALHYAARNANKQICEILINEGNVDVNAVTKGGVTALHRASMMGHLNIVELLVNANANVELQDSMNGQTALHRAVLRGHYNVSKYLMEKQPNLKDIADNKGKIPYDYISGNANDDFKILLKP